MPFRILVVLLALVAVRAEELALQGGGTAAVSRIESGGIAVAMVPDLGGKLVSLRGPDGYEWLSRSTKPYRARAGVEKFGDAEFDGADEIFPTMEACDGLPPHGEVWRLPWVRSEGPGLAFTAEGRLRSYRFARTITIEDGAIVLSYAVENRGTDELRYFYLFHPLFSIAEPLRLELAEGQQVRITGSQHNFLGQPGTVLPWETLTAGFFREATGSMAAKRFWSLSLTPLQPSLRLRRPGGSALAMSWQAEAQPHLMLWCTEASPFVGDLAHLAPEPCTGPVKRLSDAISDGSAARLPAGGVARWRIRLAFEAAR